MVMIVDNEYLAHHGIKGQRWGVRRFQNEDGTRTPAGEKRYAEGVGKTEKERKILRDQAGSGILLKKNETEMTKHYQSADKEHKEQTFKEAKAAFKGNKTTGQKVANVLSNGPIGAGLYNNLRAQGQSVAVSKGAVTASHLLLPPFGTIVAYAYTSKGKGLSDAKSSASRVANSTKDKINKRIYG